MGAHIEAKKKREDALDMWSRGLSSGVIARRLGYKSRGHVNNIILAARELGDGRAVTRATRGYAANKTIRVNRATYEALVSAIRRARHIVDYEADCRGCGEAGSDYEREPIEVLEAIDAALAKVATP